MIIPDNQVGQMISGIPGSDNSRNGGSNGSGIFKRTLRYVPKYYHINSQDGVYSTRLADKGQDRTTKHALKLEIKDIEKGLPVVA